MASFYVRFTGGEQRGFSKVEQADKHARDISGRLSGKVEVLQDLPFQADPVVSTWKNGKRR